MKLHLLLVLLVSFSFANIIFPKVQPKCDHTLTGYTGCLRGQTCLPSDVCIAWNEDLPANVNHTDILPRQLPYCASTGPRIDGRCGCDYEGATCNPSGPFGGCCDADGYCSSCSDKRDTPLAVPRQLPYCASTGPRIDGRCGCDYEGATCDASGPFGGCCSSDGYCTQCSGQKRRVSYTVSDGLTAVSTNTTLVSTDGPCVDPPIAAPASNWTSMHTLPRRSADPTNSSQEPVIVAATAVSIAAIPTSNRVVTIDGTCGANNNNTVCGDWLQGACCSLYGYCGNTTAHCGDGCQSGPCLGPATIPVPGPRPAPLSGNPGSFHIIGQSGVPAMHAALMPNGRVMFLDKVENYTQITLPDGRFAYSSEYDPNTNTVLGLSYKTNAFCSGGAFLRSGTLLNVGGNAPLTWLDPTVGDGFQGIRYLERSSPADTGSNWIEPGNQLDSARWYPTVQTMPDGTVLVVSGSLNGLDPTVPSNNNPTYEVLDSSGFSHGGSLPMDILARNQPYYMYPFVHLLNTGDIFVFVSKSSEVFSVVTNTTVSSLPDLPGDYRTYPNTGSSVLLPLSSANNYTPEVIICGGGAYQDITSPTDASCGRISPLSSSPAWELDAMPEGRVMVDGTLLPDGTIVFLNGASQGAQGFNLATEPALTVLLYDPTAPLGSRWISDATSTIPRLYHSVALLLLDGTVLVAGSNPNQMPVLNTSADVPYETEFRVERYSPPYLSGPNANRRPVDIVLSTTKIVVGVGEASTFSIHFDVPKGAMGAQIVLYHGGFVTHSLHMGMRMVYLDFEGWVDGLAHQKVTVSMPGSSNVAPPGPYVVFVVVDGVPGIGQTVLVS